MKKKLLQILLPIACPQFRQGAACLDAPATKDGDTVAQFLYFPHDVRGEQDALPQGAELVDALHDGPAHPVVPGARQAA
jgi:hypothetical protein